MTDTIRAWSYLQGVFADAQPQYSILPLMQRDFLASVLSISASVTATGANQGTAVALTSVTNVLTTVAAGTGVILNAGIPARIMNRGVSTVQIYPPVGGQLEALGTNAAFTLQSGQDAMIVFDTVNPLQGYVTTQINYWNLPTVLPAAAGQLWNNGGVLSLS